MKHGGKASIVHREGRRVPRYGVLDAAGNTISFERLKRDIEAGVKYFWARRGKLPPTPLPWSLIS